MGHHHRFGLTAFERVAETITAGGVEFALHAVAGATGGAAPAADGGRDHHLVADLQRFDMRADLDNLADGLVADAEADVVAETVALIDMQVATADTAGLHLHKRCVGLGDLRVGNGLEANVLGGVVGESFHR